VSYFDEIKAGDTVFVANSGWTASGEDVTVLSVTATQIVTASRRFRRKNGTLVGGGYRQPFIATPENAADIRTEMRRRQVCNQVERVRFKLTPASVRELQASVAAAEAFLREVGEWTEEGAP